MIIYSIKNLINGKIYIGQTVMSLEKRKSTHVYSAKGSRWVSLVGRAIKKYGIENFEFSQEDVALNIDELNKKEIEWIKKMNSLTPNGYNIKRGGDNHIMSESTKKKISQKHKKSVVSVCPETGKEVMFESVYDVLLHYNKNFSSAIYACLTGKRSTAHGLYWKRPGESIKRTRKGTSRPIYAISISDGHRLDFLSTANAGKSGFSSASVFKCLKGIQSSHLGYKWSYVDYNNDIDKPRGRKSRATGSNKNWRPIIRIDVITNEVREYKSLKFAADDGFGIHSVRNCIKGKVKSYRGYKWIYKSNDYINKKGRPERRAVTRIDITTGESKEYDSILSTKKDGFDCYGVRKCAKRQVKSYKGYYWVFKNSIITRS